jgi:hypothetical protein
MVENMRQMHTSAMQTTIIITVLSVGIMTEAQYKEYRLEPKQSPDSGNNRYKNTASED